MHVLCCHLFANHDIFGIRGSDIAYSVPANQICVSKETSKCEQTPTEFNIWTFYVNCTWYVQYDFPAR